LDKPYKGVIDCTGRVVLALLQRSNQLKISYNV